MGNTSIGARVGKEAKALGNETDFGSWLGNEFRKDTLRPLQLLSKRKPMSKSVPPTQALAQESNLSGNKRPV